MSDIAVTKAIPEDNSIRLIVNKWSESDVDDFKRHDYCGFPWQLRAFKGEQEELVVVLYSFNEEESNVWFCDINMELFLINQNGKENHNIKNVSKYRYTPENVISGIEIVLDKPSLLEDPVLGFIKDDSLILEARLTILSKPAKRFRKKIEFDILSPSPKADGILIIEGRKVYVSKQLLAIQSPFFDRIFFGKFKEANELESEIKEVIFDEFEGLLKMLYRTGELFSDENVEYILKLADRFEMMSILDDVEKYLLTSEGPDIHKKLSLSEQYNLIVLQDQLIANYTAALIRQLNGSPEYAKLQEETKDILFKKYIELTTPK